MESAHGCVPMPSTGRELNPGTNARNKRNVGIDRDSFRRGIGQAINDAVRARDDELEKENEKEKMMGKEETDEENVSQEGTS